MTKDIFYWVYLIILLVSQILNVIGSFIAVPYKHITFWDSYKMSLPYIIVQRILSNIAIFYINKFALFTNNQIVMMILLMQFIITLIFNIVYLHNKNTISDYIGITIIIIAYYISVYSVITNFKTTFNYSFLIF